MQKHELVGRKMERTMKSTPNHTITVNLIDINSLGLKKTQKENDDTSEAIEDQIT